MVLNAKTSVYKTHEEGVSIVDMPLPLSQPGTKASRNPKKSTVVETTNTGAQQTPVFDVPAASLADEEVGAQVVDQLRRPYQERAPRVWLDKKNAVEAAVAEALAIAEAAAAEALAIAEAAAAEARAIEHEQLLQRRAAHRLFKKKVAARREEFNAKAWAVCFRDRPDQSFGYAWRFRRLRPATFLAKSKEHKLLMRQVYNTPAKRLARAYNSTRKWYPSLPRLSFADPCRDLPCLDRLFKKSFNARKWAESCLI